MRAPKPENERKGIQAVFEVDLRFVLYLCALSVMFPVRKSL